MSETPSRQDRLDDVHMHLSEESLQFALRNPFEDEGELEDLYSAPPVQPSGLWACLSGLSCFHWSWCCGPTVPTGFNTDLRLLENDLLGEDEDDFLGAPSSKPLSSGSEHSEPLLL